MYKTLPIQSGPCSQSGPPTPVRATAQRIYNLSLFVAAFVVLSSLNVKAAAQGKIDTARADAERGEVSSTTIMVAMLVLLAVAVGTIITDRITSKAESINP